MKFQKLIESLFFSLFLIGTSVATEPPPHWVRGERVYYFSRPEIQAILVVFKQSPEAWAYLTVSAEYEPKLMREQYNGMTLLFPKSEIYRIGVQSEPIGSANLHVGVLGISREIKWSQRPAGPVFSQEFLLSKKQFELVEKASDLAIRFDGKIAVNVPETVTVESIQMPRENCKNLFKSGPQLENVLIHFAEFAVKINAMAIRYGESKKRLMQSLLRECLSLKSDTSAGSFDELLRTEVDPKINGGILKGETQGETLVRTEIDYPAVFPKKASTY